MKSSAVRNADFAAISTPFKPAGLSANWLVAGLFAAATILSRLGSANADVLYASNYGASGSISEIAPGGVVSTFVSGLPYPSGIAFDSSGNLYVALQKSDQIDKITPAGTVSTFATGLPVGSVGDLQGLAFDSSGNLYACTGNGFVDKITPSGAASTFFNGLPAGSPDGIAIDTSGDLFVAVNGGPALGSEIVKIAPAGGSFSNFSGVVDQPVGVAFDQAGDLWVANSDSGELEEFKSPLRGNSFTFIAEMLHPEGLTFDSAGDLFVASDPTTISEALPNGTFNTYTTALPGTEFGYLADSTTTVPEPTSLALLCERNVHAPAAA